MGPGIMVNMLMAAAVQVPNLILAVVLLVQELMITIMMFGARSSEDNFFLNMTVNMILLKLIQPLLLMVQLM